MERRLTKRSILTVLVAVLMILSIVGIAMLYTHVKASADEDKTKWNGDLIAAGWGSESVTAPEDYKVTYESGESGKVTAIEIGSAAAFAWFAHEVYADSAHDLDGATVTLTTDIDLQNHMWIPIGQMEEPSALPSHRFSGTFDGAQHKIIGLSTGDLFTKVTNGGAGDSYYVQYNDTVQIPVSSATSGAFNYGLFGVSYNLTVKDLTVEDVDIQIVNSGSGPLLKSVGAIVGYSVGSLTLENCASGSLATDDKILVKGYGALVIESVSGLVGRAWAYATTPVIDGAKDINLKNCKNYADIDFVDNSGVPASSNYAKIGALIGHQTFYINSVVDSCTNYGNIRGGQHVGGVTSFWSNTFTTNVKFEILNCDNYGNIFAAGDNAGGFLGNMQNAIGAGATFTLNIKNCSNYGNIAAKTRVGGIIGQQIQASDRVYATFTNNYNYGDIYGLGTNPAVGGYIGTLSSPYINKNNQSTTELHATISGGSMGTVYRAGTGTTNSLFGNMTTFFESKGKLNYVDAGTIATATITNIDEIPTDHLSDTQERYTNTVTEGKFIFSDETKTVLVGVADDQSVSGTLEIPSTVTKIGYAAFAGCSDITAIDWADSNVTEIADWAFAGASITTLTLPESLNTIGNAAFAGCAKLNQVIFPANAANITLGTGVFNGTREDSSSNAQGAFLIAANSTQYWALRSSGSYNEYLDTLTYVITVKFVYDGQPVSGGDVQKLRGQSYKVVKEGSGLWTMNADALFGPTDKQDARWYMADGGVVYNSDNADDVLLAEGDTVTLYAYSQSEGKTFIARTGIVYDPNRSYTMKELNALLHASSDRITEEMNPTIVEYNGSKTDLPTVIHNAGIYKIKIDQVEFSITIEKATLDLSNLANLEWRITAIETSTMQSVNYQLMSYTLYIYTYTSAAGGELEGKEYPSRDILSDMQIRELKLNNSYKTVYVDYSVVRNRGGLVTIEIAGSGYSVSYTLDSNIAMEVGSYKAEAELTADSNYVFTIGNIAPSRGMKIEYKDGDNTKATVSKEWYIVDISNWLTNGAGADFTIENHTYGDQSYSVSAPRPAYGDPSAITMYLSHDTIGTIGDASGFGVGEIARYINYVMPAGTYTLRIVVAGLVAKDEDGTEIWHNSFSETLTFTVDKATLPALDAVHTALRGKSFEFEDKDLSVYNATAATTVNAYLNQVANLSRIGTVWNELRYFDYYSAFAIEFNLSRNGDDLYVAAADLGANMPDDYTVYYRISALNYYSSVEKLASGTRYDYNFKLVKYHVMATPEVIDDGLVYTGSRVVPTLEASNLYAAVWDQYDPYIAGGTHTVSFEFYDKVHYRWEGHETEKNYNATANFTIAQAENVFTVSLNMLGWSFETFDAAINNIRAGVRFLDVGEFIRYRVVKEGETEAIEGLDGFTTDDLGRVDEFIAALLNALSTGEYRLYASVAETANYYLAQDAYISFTVTKAMNSWATDDDALSLPSWIVGRWNEEDSPIIVKAAHGFANYRITDIDGNEYYNSVTGVNKLNECKAGKYLLTAWVDETSEFAALAERTFTIEVFAKIGLPWWATLAITVGALGVAALIIFILWKKGVFQILTEKLVVSIRTRASVEATIAAVRAAKMTEEGKQSVADAKRRERLEKLRQKAQQKRDMTPEERAAELEAKAAADAERAEKLRERSESALARAAKMRSEEPAEEAEADEPAETEEPTETAEVNEPAETEEPTETPEADEPAETAEADEPAETAEPAEEAEADEPAEEAEADEKPETPSEE